MMLIQIVLLNMLIAVMAESHNRVSQQSELVALYQRAMLILEHEQEEVSQIQAYKARAKAIPGQMDDLIFKSLTDRAQKQLERVCPRWLHVLMPAEHQREEEGTQAEELQQLRAMRKEMASFKLQVRRARG